LILSYLFMFIHHFILILFILKFFVFLIYVFF